MPKILQMVSQDEHNMRLDRWVRTHFPAVNQARLQKMLRHKDIRLNGTRPAAATLVHENDTVQLWLDEQQASAKAPAPVADLSSFTLYENEHFIVLNKPAGLAVQGGSGLKQSLDKMAPHLRLVHRLDKETSGVLVMAKTRQDAQMLTQAFENRQCHKTYYALVQGVLQPRKGQITLPLKKAKGVLEKMIPAPDGQTALTLYQTLQTADGLSWVRLNPITGRTHQLRAHCAAMGCPIVGDKKYGTGGGKLHLHAAEIRLELPTGPLCIQAPLPPHIIKTLTQHHFRQGEH